MKALKNLSSQIFTNSADWDSMANFLLIFLGLKRSKRTIISAEVEERANMLCDWLYNYSNTKFEGIFSIPELKVLFQYMYENHTDMLLPQKQASENKSVDYKIALDQMKLKF